jgi:REP element-mobilizing transposase RayT
MARPLRLHLPGANYHVMSRGNAKQPIFVRPEDYERFLDLLSSTVARFNVRCRAYCLMPNHFHLLVEPAEHPLSRMMQQLNSAYSQWFNRRHDRVGHLLQGRFKALLVDRDQYLLQVLRYIVRNPVEAGLANDPGEWHWSSYRATVGATAGPAWLALQDVWRIFDAEPCRACQLFGEFVAAGADHSEPSGPVVFGSPSLTAEVGVALKPHRNVADISRTERYAVRPSLEQLLAEHREGRAQDAWMCEAFRRHGYTLRAIGEFVGYHPSTVLRRIRRSESVSEPDPVPLARQQTTVKQRAKIKI